MTTSVKTTLPFDGSARFCSTFQLNPPAASPLAWPFAFLRIAERQYLPVRLSPCTLGSGQQEWSWTLARRSFSASLGTLSYFPKCVQLACLRDVSTFGWFTDCAFAFQFKVMTPDKPLDFNKGRHNVHTGGAYDSHLLLPIINY